MVTIVTQANKWFLLQLIPNEHVFPYSYKGFQMSTPTSEQVSSWM
jgi:hypothetical protein